MNKKGEASIWVMISIVLGVLILVFSVYGLVTQKSIFNRQVNTVSDEVNVDEVVLVCNSYVDIDKSFSYCCDKKKVNIGEEILELSCDELSGKDFISGRISALDCSSVNC